MQTFEIQVQRNGWEHLVTVNHFTDAVALAKTYASHNVNHRLHRVVRTDWPKAEMVFTTR